jgi:AcrR family transcriptional regulator
MEKFFHLPIEKQRKIIDAAINCFGANGYKKTSVSDIASAAGISKAMVFHYFGSKKDLYYYLIDYTSDIILKEVSENFDKSVTDFFERIRMITEIRIAVLKRHQGLFSFLYSVYQEREEEVREGAQRINRKGEIFKNVTSFADMDSSKFKEGTDPRLVMKMLRLIGEGYANYINKGMTLEDVTEEFQQILQLLRSNLYREEYI